MEPRDLDGRGGGEPDPSAGARRLMVEEQLRARGVRDARVLAVMGEVPRHRFVAPELGGRAYGDWALPSLAGQTISQPYMVARMLELLEIAATHRVLEIGTGTGYLTACLSLLGAQVTSIDIHASLSAAAAVNLSSVSGARAQLQVRDAFDPTPLGEYDVIAVTGSMPLDSHCFEKALRVGGRLFEVVGTPPLMDARIVRRVEADQWIRESVFETFIAPLINAPQAPRFVF